MNSYRVELKASAKKELDALPDNILARVVGKLESLLKRPGPPDARS